MVYSIDEVFIDATPYLSHYNMTAHDLVMTMIREVLYTTGITATAGIGTNLYLAKLAMDITAKHAAPDKDGVRIAELDEESFRYLLWDHKPLTDFWMTGPGTVKRLEKHGIHTMGELAYFSTVNQDILTSLVTSSEKKQGSPEYCASIPVTGSPSNKDGKTKASIA